MRMPLIELERRRERAATKEAMARKIFIQCDGGCGKRTTLFEGVKVWWRCAEKIYCPECGKKL